MENAMSHQVERRNNAVNVNTNTQNGKHVQIAITDRGSDWYFTVMCVMGVVGLSCIAAAGLKPRTHRIFFYITAAINLTACIAYFSMGSNLGWTPIDVEFLRSDSIVRGRNREIFYVRYIDWFVTTPLLLMDLLLTAGLPWPTIIWTMFMDEAMIITGLVGALVKSRYKWGYYAFGCAAMFYVFYILGFQGRAHAKRLGNDVHRTYVTCGVVTLFVWMLYPIAWGLCEGGNVISPDSEAIFYGILDLIAKPVFSILLIAGHWNIDPARMGLRIHDFDDAPARFATKEQLEGSHTGHNDVDGSTGTATGYNGTGRSAAVSREENGSGVV